MIKEMNREELEIKIKELQHQLANLALNTSIGYKAFDRELRCSGFQFKVGKTYNHSGPLRLHHSGFHFCESPENVFKFYKFQDTTRVCRVETTRKVISDPDSSVTSELTILQELTWEEVLRLVNGGKNNRGLGNQGDENIGFHNEGNGNSGHYNLGHHNTGNYNPGNRNSGICNSGNSNTGSMNKGDRNTGDENSGECNTGGRNQGNCNTGYRNQGNSNTGDYNLGHHNTGSSNIGNHNTGHYNLSNYNTGFFNTTEPTLRLFNKDTGLTRFELSIPTVFLEFQRWIPSHELSEQQKIEYPDHITDGGITQAVSYRDAWKQAWKNLDDDVKTSFLNLPNFDSVIFEEITGIKTKD